MVVGNHNMTNKRPNLRNGKIVVRFGYMSECCECAPGDFCDSQDQFLKLISKDFVCNPLSLPVPPEPPEPPEPPDPPVPPEPPEPCRCECEGIPFLKQYSVSFFNSDGELICKASLTYNCDTNRFEGQTRCCSKNVSANINCDQFILCLDIEGEVGERCFEPIEIDCDNRSLIYDDITLPCEGDPDDGDLGDDDDNDDIPGNGNPIGPPFQDPPFQNPPPPFGGVGGPGGGNKLIIPGQGDGMVNINNNQKIRRLCKCCNSDENIRGFNITLSGVKIKEEGSLNECCDGLNNTWFVEVDKRCKFDKTFPIICEPKCSCCLDSFLEGVLYNISDLIPNLNCGLCDNNFLGLEIDLTPQLFPEIDDDDCCSKISGNFLVPTTSVDENECRGEKTFDIDCDKQLTILWSIKPHDQGREISIKLTIGDFDSNLIEKTESSCDLFVGTSNVNILDNQDIKCSSIKVDYKPLTIEDDCCNALNGEFFVPKDDFETGICKGSSPTIDLDLVNNCQVEIDWYMYCNSVEGFVIERKLLTDINFIKNNISIKKSFEIIQPVNPADDFNCKLSGEKEISFDCDQAKKIKVNTLGTSIGISGPVRVYGDIKCDRKKKQLSFNIEFFNRKILTGIFDFKKATSCKNFKLPNPEQLVNDGPCDFSNAFFTFESVMENIP
jgi:hypothetical protein